MHGAPLEHHKDSAHTSNFLLAAQERAIMASESKVQASTMFGEYKTYVMSKRLEGVSFEDGVAKLKAAMKANGFGVPPGSTDMAVRHSCYVSVCTWAGATSCATPTRQCCRHVLLYTLEQAMTRAIIVQVNEVLASKGLVAPEEAAKRPYQIIGFCNPPNAHKALQAEAGIGLLLPCNGVVAVAEDGCVEVALVDPLAMLGIVLNKDKLRPIVDAVREAMTKALAAL